MTIRCFMTRAVVLVVGIALPLLVAAPNAGADHVAIVIDGNIDDLRSVAVANATPEDGGYLCADDTGEIGSGQCAYYVNGFDVDSTFVFLDFKTAGGALSSNIILYAGWRQAGVVGDVDGDGGASTFDPSSPGASQGCATSDGTGIGPFESYVALIDINCDGIPDAQVGIKADAVINFFTLAVVPGATFARSGNFLELRVPDIMSLLPEGADPCNITIDLRSNAEFDQLAEDDCDAPYGFAIPPSISITKTPASQDACPGEEVSWTITVTNDGICNLDDVRIDDVLGAGLTYVSDDQGSTGDANNRQWNITDLGAGESFVIDLVASVDAPCAASTLGNDVSVEGQHVPDPRCGDPRAAVDRASAIVNCTNPDVEIDKVLNTSSTSVGGVVQVTLTISNTGTSVLDPIDVTDQLDAGVGFNAAQVIGGTCGTTVKTFGSQLITFNSFSLNPGQSCTIIYEVTCEADGSHRDVSEVTAYCQGTFPDNPVTDSDDASFDCRTEGENCPRTPGFWTQQCAQRGNGSTKFSLAQMTQIAECVDDNSTFFDWPGGTDFSSFCRMINPDRPMNQFKQLKRHFASLLANFCTGDIGLIAANGDIINLVLSTSINCDGVDAETIGELIAEIDAALNAGDSDKYGALLECADAINNGEIIPLSPSCSEGTEPVLDRAGDIDPSSFRIRTPAPNPFRDRTRITYDVPGGESQMVRIGIYNVAGRLVRQLVSRAHSAGSYEISWDGKDSGGVAVQRGVYFVRGIADGRVFGTNMRVLYLR